MVYSSQKTSDDLGDKVSGEEKAKVETEIENVKKALEGTDTEAIKQATEKLTTVFYEISEKLYKQNAPQGDNNTANGGPKEGSDGTVHDTEYKVENDKDENK